MSKKNELLLRKDDNGICYLTLNRPKARNALSIDLIELLIEEFRRIDKDRNVKVIVIEANGPAFCAGHDLKELKEKNKQEFTRKVFERCSEMMLSIMHLKQPVIAKINGIATAAGCQLVATSDLAIASTNATFATPGVNIGLFCTTPSVALSRVIPQKKSLEMLFTGEPISAKTAANLGLINSEVSEENLNNEVEKLANILKKKSSRILAIGKIAFYKQIEKPITESYKFANMIMTENMLEEDCVEGISAFVEKREPNWKNNSR